MRSRLTFFLTSLLISANPVFALSQSDLATSQFTLQVASFPDSTQAASFAAGLAGAGERPSFDSVEIEGRGNWTRVLIGLFDTTDAARRHGLTLVARGLIKEFLVRKAGSNHLLTRPRRVFGKDSQVATQSVGSASLHGALRQDRTSFGSHSDSATGKCTATKLVGDDIDGSQAVPGNPFREPLPVTSGAAFHLAPRVDTSLLPRPDPVTLAFRLVTGDARSTSGMTQRGGLWISGDKAEGLARLHWIVGQENSGLVKLEPDGRVRFDMKLLAQSAVNGETRVQDALRAVEYISSNEGLLLLVQVAQGRYRYLLHIGRQTPTYGKSIDTAGSINLDNNIDSRINPYRKNGRKLDTERPPLGFDSLIALNPVARWFNLSTSSWVQSGEIVFHELAEAYAKLELGVDYLDQGSRSGAHTLALDREQRLKLQRPGADIVVTSGSNRLLRTEAEIRLFTAEASAGGNQR
jgi:hypothetical protein